MISKSYGELSESEKSFLFNPPKSPAKNQPSSNEFESWKSYKDFALWLDGTVIPNSKLNDIRNTEIAFYLSNIVHQNSRAGRFPQEHQVHLYST